jgi:hypothetical protein
LNLNLNFFHSRANTSQRNIFFTTSEYEDFYIKNYNNASAKFALFAKNGTVSWLNKICQCSSLLLPETLITKPIALAIDKNHFLFDLIDDTLQRIIAAGIPQHSAVYHKWVLYRGISEEVESNPKSIALNDVAIAFNLWFITLGISTLVLVCEFSWMQLKILSFHMREFLGLALFFALLHRRLNTFY